MTDMPLYVSTISAANATTMDRMPMVVDIGLFSSFFFLSGIS